MIYKARYVLPMDGRIVEPGEVLVRDGEISAVGTGLAEANPAEPTCDLGKCALLPGFVNAHSHIDLTLARNKVDALNLWDWIDAVCYNKSRVPDYETVTLSAKLGAAECVRSGVTCLGDSTFTGAAAEALGTLGLRGIAYLEVFGQSAGVSYAQVFHKRLDDVREQQSACSQLITIGISPHTIYTSNRELLRLCTDTCAELGIPVAFHLAETRAEADYSLDGTGPISDWRRRLGYEPMASGLRPAEYLHQIGFLRPGVCLAHCVDLSPQEVELVARSGVGVAHCPRSNAYLGAGIAPVAELVAAGADVGIGTDSAGSCLRFDFFEEMRFALALQRARAEDAATITAKDVLRLATVGGARALGLADRIGTIEPGKSADLIAVDLSKVLPGEDIWLAVLSRSPSDVRLVVVNGCEVVRDGLPVGLDLRALRTELEGRLESWLETDS